MRLLLALLVSLFVGCSPWALAGGPRSVDTVAMLQQETVVLYQGERTYCAGVYIGPHTILTADHCVRHAGMDDVMLELCGLTDDEYDGCKDWDPVGKHMSWKGLDMPLKAEATVVRSAHDIDLALLDTGANSSWVYSTVSLAPDVQDGQALHVVGHPRGITWTYAHGYVASAHRPYAMFSDVEIDWMQVDATITGGNSGGGAFSEDGRLVGICSWQFVSARAGFFVPLRTIQDFTNGRVR